MFVSAPSLLHVGEVGSHSYIYTDTPSRGGLGFVAVAPPTSVSPGVAFLTTPQTTASLGSSVLRHVVPGSKTSEGSVSSSA